MLPCLPALVLLLAAPVALAGATGKAEQTESVDIWPNKYNRYFRKYTKRYFGPYFDWRWFKAQAVAESGLEPDARSKAGARGLMQILPSTYQEITEDNPHFIDLDDPRWNIAAGIYYNRVLYRKWTTPPPGAERLYFVFGSYNAGYRRILEASQQAEQPAERWTQVAPHAPSQTRHYVKRIRKLMHPKVAE